MSKIKELQLNFFPYMASIFVIDGETDEIVSTPE